MGFGEQLREILGRLPETRQTVLFSATLPKLLVDFAKAGLTEPTLIRLDVETKIPETLKLGFFYTRMEAKPALLLHLLNHTIPKEEQVVIFAATRYCNFSPGVFKHMLFKLSLNFALPVSLITGISRRKLNLDFL